MERNKRYYMLTEDGDSADLYIFGTITHWGKWDDDDPNRSAYNIVTELQGVKASNINVHINSGGGDVSEGLAIFNTLKNSGKDVTTYCDGFACSAASVVFMAGKHRIMSPASLLMIHNAWMFTEGNADELRKQADDLDKINQTAVEAYKTVAVISEDEIKQMMDDETWISADDALSYGFATEITGNDSGSDPQQSAMAKIRNDLIRSQQSSCLTVEEISDVVSKVIDRKIEERKKKEPHQETWDEFMEGKNENR